MEDQHFAVQTSNMRISGLFDVGINALKLRNKKYSEAQAGAEIALATFKAGSSDNITVVVTYI